MPEVSITVLRNILEAQEKIAIENRKRFDEQGVFVINLMSSPGAGKTSLLEQTLSRLRHWYRIAVIEGDIQSEEDARRIHSLGVEAVQINTGGTCHLDANMIQSALAHLSLASRDLLIIENVGNLVCPAEFDLGEHVKVMMLSVTEGDDKPLKYPLMFQRAAVLVINKIDLLPYVTCDIGKIRDTVRTLNPHQRIVELSCKTGEGVEQWTGWIEEAMRDERLRQRLHL